MGIAHVLIVPKFEDAGFLRVGDVRVNLEGSGC
jgi:hypothetical protein